jgi:hypothetical protein
VLITSAPLQKGRDAIDFQQWEDDRFVIRWKGYLADAAGTGAGDTIARLAGRLRTAPLARLAGGLSGVFGLFVLDRETGVWQAACDNAGLYRIFYDDRRIGTSFLGLIAARPAGSSTVSRERLVEYLAHGGVFGAATVIEEIRKLRADEVIELAPAARGGRIRLERKTLPDVVGDASDIFARQFALLGRTLRGRRVSVDATGGLDSRLHICLLQRHGVAFELATSGRPGIPDADVAQAIARLLDKPFHLAPHQIDTLEADLAAVFEDGDGQADPRLFHRNRQNALARLGRGVEVIVHGGGGSNFRDFFYVQDFPRYGVRRVNFERFYDLRIAPTPLPQAQLTPAGAALLQAVRHRTLASFAAYRSATNNISYGKAAYFLRVPESYGPFYSSYINLGLDVVAPFIDFPSAQAGIALPTSRAIFGRWHRQMITALAPELAALPTALGSTASSARQHALRDVARVGGVYLARGLNKLGRRGLGRPLIPVTSSLDADAPGYLEALRATGLCRRAVERLTAADILAAEVTPAAIRNVHLGRVLLAGMVLEHLESRRDADPACAGPGDPQPAARAAGS